MPRIPLTKPWLLMLEVLAVIACASGLMGQVHYHENGAPWNQKADAGPDAEVDGWYLNLGITGLRVQLMPEEPKHLLVKHVFVDSPAHRVMRVGDVILGVEGEEFQTEHRNGYGMEVFGAHGPVLEFAEALEAAQAKGKGRLKLRVRRGDKEADCSLEVGTRYGCFAPSYPADCGKSERILSQLLPYLLKHQKDDGSWGSPPIDLFAPLALLASGERKYRSAVEKNLKFHARTTAAEDNSWLINWRYMTAAIVMSEYYLATEKSWLKPELGGVYDFLISSQYMDPSQIDEKAKDSHPGDVPRKPGDHVGGWGHNPGHEGYGAISMITAQGAIAFALMKECGLDVAVDRHQAAYAFLERGTGKNGYLWYKDEGAGDDKWADMGRTGAAAIANLLGPYQDLPHQERASKYAKIIGAHPESFPDTHGSPLMGMGFVAMAAAIEPTSFRSLMDANKWWFTLSQCCDGSFYYQPNRDNAGYGADSRLLASAVTAFILQVPKANLRMTGRASTIK